jgi:hypothetical protein
VNDMYVLLETERCFICMYACALFDVPQHILCTFVLYLMSMWTINFYSILFYTRKMGFFFTTDHHANFFCLGSPFNIKTASLINCRKVCQCKSQRFYAEVMTLIVKLGKYRIKETLILAVFLIRVNLKRTEMKGLFFIILALKVVFLFHRCLCQVVSKDKESCHSCSFLNQFF